jgi:hypothetical protein
VVRCTLRAAGALGTRKANFHSQFKNKTLSKLFERLCEQTQQKKFYAIWKKLDDLTKKASEEIAKRPVNPEPGE